MEIGKKILFLLSVILLLPLTALADVPTVGGMVLAAEGQLVALGIWVIIIAWVVTGILFLTVSSNPGRLGAAKTALYVAIAGTIIVGIAGVAETFVANLFGIH